jgi:hypothetical protein
MVLFGGRGGMLAVLARRWSLNLADALKTIGGETRDRGQGTKCIPFGFDPSTVFGFFLYAFADGFCTDCAHLALLVVVDDCWDLRGTHDMLLSGKSAMNMGQV